MTGPREAVDGPPMAALPAAERALLLLTATYLLLAPFAGSSGLRTAVVILAAVAIFASRRFSLRNDLAALPRALCWTLAAWALLALASTAWSISPRYSLGEVRAEVVYGIAAFLVFFVAARRLERLRFWCLALLLGTVLAFLGQLVQELAGVKLSRHPIDGGPGPWSTHLVLVAPLLLLLVWPPPWGMGLGVVAKAAALVLLLAAAADTANRIIWAAFAVQLAVIFVCAREGLSASVHAGALRRLAVFAAIAVVLGFGASVLERNQRHFRYDPSVTASIDRDLRPRLWDAAWGEFLRAPVLGHGFGREILESRFLQETPRGANHPPMRHAHNTFIDAALQLGAVGLALLCTMLGLVAARHAQALRTQAAPLGVIGLAMVAGYGVKNMTDDFFYRHNALVFWALTGMLLGLASAHRAKR